MSASAGLLLGIDAGRRRVEQVLPARFARATVTVEPDYVAAYMAAETEIVTIAGTGSIAGRSRRLSGSRVA